MGSFGKSISLTLLFCIGIFIITAGFAIYTYEEKSRAFSTFGTMPCKGDKMLCNQNL